MKTSKRFDNAVDKLIKAYFNNSLKAGALKKCAVGNICEIGDRWFKPVDCARDGVSPTNPIIKQGKEAETKSGYSLKELVQIEESFENNTQISIYYIHSQKEIDQDQFNGLCAVFDKLSELDGLDEPVEFKEQLKAKAI